MAGRAAGRSILIVPALAAAFSAGSHAQSASPAAACADPAAIAEGLRLERLLATRVDDGLEWADATVHSGPRMTLLGGACADLVAAVSGSNFFLADGRVLWVQGDAPPAIRDDGLLRLEDEFQPTIDGYAPPAWRGADFVMASEVWSRSTPEGTVMDYLGVWTGDGRSEVGVMTRLTDGRVSAPKPLFSSTLPVRSISYFPAPDTQAGTLTILQESGDGPRLVTVAWMHPDFF